LPEFLIPGEGGRQPFYHGGDLGYGHHLELFNLFGFGFIDWDKFYLESVFHTFFPIGIPFVQKEALVIPELLHVGSATMDMFFTCQDLLLVVVHHGVEVLDVTPEPETSPVGIVDSGDGHFSIGIYSVSLLNLLMSKSKMIQEFLTSMFISFPSCSPYRGIAYVFFVGK